MAALRKAAPFPPVGEVCTMVSIATLPPRIAVLAALVLHPNLLRQRTMHTQAAPTALLGSAEPAIRCCEHRCTARNCCYSRCISVHRPAVKPPRLNPLAQPWHRAQSVIVVGEGAACYTRKGGMHFTPGVR